MQNKTESEEMIHIPKWEYEKLKGYLKPQKDWQDRDDELTEAIDELHPCETGDHKTYTRAMELIGNRHSKGSLVCLVNYFLAREKQLKTMQERIEDSEIIKLRYTQGYNQEQMSWDYAQGLSNADDCVDSGVLAIQKYVKGEMM
jgi:hypothetical protein